MQNESLKAISPIDGRYHGQLAHLGIYFSEFALIQYRVKVEVAYFIFLAERKSFKLSTTQKKHLLEIVSSFSLEDAERIKETENRLDFICK